MEVQEKTLTGLQCLITLYRQGHRDPVVDLTVEKLLVSDGDFLEVAECFVA